MGSGKVLKLAIDLASMVHAVEISSHAGVFGTAGTDSALLQMRKAAAELVQAARKEVGIDVSIDGMESALLTAGAIGLLSQTELEEYLKGVDELRVSAEEKER
jgi:hypothetical protein